MRVHIPVAEADREIRKCRVVEESFVQLGRLRFIRCEGFESKVGGRSVVDDGRLLEVGEIHAEG
jgi:hypothetical protein